MTLTQQNGSLMSKIETYLNYLELMKMDASEFVGAGEWLKADELKGRTVTLEICDVQAVSFDNENGKETKLGLMFKGKDKGIIANKTNTKALIDSLGSSDTEKWIGRSITASPNPTPLGLGFSLRGMPVDGDFDDDVPF